MRRPLPQGADVEAPVRVDGPWQGMTALMTAAGGGRLEVLQWLLE